MLTILIAAGVAALCAAVRWYLVRPNRKDSEYAGGQVEVTELWNEGAPFDLPIPRWAVTILSVVCLGLFWTQRKTSPLGVGLILGGGLSNLLERLRAGRVFDYLRFPKAPGRLRRYVYNLADFAVFLGGVLWLLGGHRK